MILRTAVAEESDRAVGPEIGADYSVSRPVSPRKLPVRIKAVMRRTQGLPPHPEPRSARSTDPIAGPWS